MSLPVPLFRAAPLTRPRACPDDDGGGAEGLSGAAAAAYGDELLFAAGALLWHGDATAHALIKRRRLRSWRRPAS